MARPSDTGQHQLRGFDPFADWDRPDRTTATRNGLSGTGHHQPDSVVDTWDDPGGYRAGPDGPSGHGRDTIDIDHYFDEDEDSDELYDQTSAMTRNALEWAVVLVGAVLVALLLRATVFQAFFIPSESMETTLMVDDRVLVNKLSYDFHGINRGDVIVFSRPEAGDTTDLIKRVIGLPGETIEAHDNSIYIDGNRLVEPYLDPGTAIFDFEPTIVPEGHVFVMGDNRDDSQDSRVFGSVSEERVIGRAFVLFWPFNRAGSL